MEMELSMDDIKSMIESNGGSDLMKIPNYDEPEMEELQDMLNTVQEDWYKINIDDYYIIIPSNKPPSNISADEWLEIKNRSISFGAADEAKYPVYWLMMKMYELKIDPIFTEQRIVDLLKNCHEDKHVWTRVVVKYNGYIQILKELNLYAKDEDGKPMDLCIKFYAQKYKDKTSSTMGYTEDELNKMENVVFETSDDDK